MRPPLARRLAPFGTTIFAEMTRLAAEYRAINLSQGFPDFDGPEFAREAAIHAIRAGHGQYARGTGLPELNRALADKYRRDYAMEFDPDSEITVTSGATEAIFAAIAGICDPGDEIILFEPYYDSYKPGVIMAGGIPRFIRLEWPGWQFDEGKLRDAFTPKTRAILLNTPHNPSGKVFSREELALISRLCLEHDVICITDEVYEHLVYDGRHVPIATLPGMRERTITISSFGKTFSLTGWKIGWAAACAPLSAAVRAAHQFITFATATPLQHGAAAAIVQAAASYYEELLASYLRRRDFLAGALTRIGFEVPPCTGSYFLCAGFRKFSQDDDGAFCRHLIENVGVAAIPPRSFYGDPDFYPDYVRFAFCKRDETLRAAAARLEKLCV